MDKFTKELFVYREVVGMPGMAGGEGVCTMNGQEEGPIHTHTHTHNIYTPIHSLMCAHTHTHTHSLTLSLTVISHRGRSLSRSLSSVAANWPRPLSH